MKESWPGENSPENDRFSPEIKEAVLKKVRDINEPGIAYSRVNYMLEDYGVSPEEILRYVLQEGLLGSNPFPDALPSPETWAENARRVRFVWESTDSGGARKIDSAESREDAMTQRQKARAEGSHLTPLHRKRESDTIVVHFNIVGRASDEFDPQRTEISQSIQMSMPGAIGLIFRLDKFKEDSTRYGSEGLLEAYAKLNTYHAVNQLEHARGVSKENPKTGKQLPHTEFGFVLSARVAPRFFEGVVFNGPHLDGAEDKYAVDKSPEAMERTGEKIVKAMLDAHKDDPENLLPIYDVDGNLWWPEKMDRKKIEKLTTTK